MGSSFGKVNTGGVSLTVFELLTATFAIDNFNLRDDWSAREKELKKYKALASIENTDFLQAVTFLVTQQRRLTAQAERIANEQLSAVSCKRKEVLRMTMVDYQKWAGVTGATRSRFKSLKLHAQGKKHISMTRSAGFTPENQILFFQFTANIINCEREQSSDHVLSIEGQGLFCGMMVSADLVPDVHNSFLAPSDSLLANFRVRIAVAVRIAMGVPIGVYVPIDIDVSADADIPISVDVPVGVGISAVVNVLTTVMPVVVTVSMMVFPAS
jgi:hypothetical protein